MHVDIVIVGAGLVGLPLAHALMMQGWQVAVVDAGREPELPDVNSVEDASLISSSASPAPLLTQRCTALSLGTQRWLSQQGLWSDVAADACAIERVHVSHKGYFGATRLNADELGVPAVGYVVNNREYARVLVDQLRGSTVQLHYNASVVKVDFHADSVSVQAEGAPDIKARLLIAADGISSIVRESAGIKTKQVDYDQAAVLGMVKIGLPHQNVAYERFTSSGPLAFLPRADQHMSFVDCLELDKQVEVEQMDASAYLARLQSRFGYRLGRLEAVGPRIAVPLLRIEALEQIASRTLLLGNAMRLVHPVGGQGYNLAVRDMVQLIALLGDRSDSRDPGDQAMLAEFVSLRSADQFNVVRFTDTLARGFRGHASMAGHLRSAALLGLDVVSPLRRKFAAHTMGLSK